MYMKLFITIIIIVFAVVVGIFLFGENQVSQAPTGDIVSNTMPVPGPEGEGVLEMIVTPAPQPPVSPQPPAPQEVTITYTDTGYVPSPIRIAVGTTVTFKNMSSRQMWTASALHPTHTIYPQHTLMCATIGGSDFDACKGIAPGDSWSFRFDFKGDWLYHDHLMPSNRGEVSVE